jgi:HEPN domain-containing protein
VSQEHDKADAWRWLRTAQDDIEAAQLLLAGGKHAQACFLCQQAAEKAVKAVFYAHGVETWGHSVKKLIGDVAAVAPDAGAALAGHANGAAVLDRFYIPARYPNGLPDLTPAEAHSAEDAESAIRTATVITNLVATHLSAP